MTSPPKRRRPRAGGRRKDKTSGDCRPDYSAVLLAEIERVERDLSIGLVRREAAIETLRRVLGEVRS